MTATKYHDFLQTKRLFVPNSGFDVSLSDLNPMLFPFQKDIVQWTLRKGKAAIFADCGLGKTPMQLEWAVQVHKHTGGNVLTLAPLAVSQQTKREGEKFNIPVTVCRKQSDVKPGINITNYEMLQHFDPDEFVGIVGDESSILKSYEGVLRKQITEFASTIPYRLACTATPAPNDLQELSNHSEFFSLLSGKEMLAMFFIQDGNTTHKWRLKGHAKSDFWRWLASWSVTLRYPSDLGYSDDGFILPPLQLNHIVTEFDKPYGDRLFAVEAQTLNERREARRSTLPMRVCECAERVNADDKPWIVWCDFNAEGDALKKSIPGSVEIRGSDTLEHKEKALIDFLDGKTRVLISKPSISAHGLNLQHCANMAFVGLSDSFEMYYQAIRRCWRFGQKQPVNVYIYTTDIEGAVVKNIERKEAQAMDMMDQLVRHTEGLALDKTPDQEMEYREDTAQGKGWKLLLGDSIERMDEIPDESVGLCLYSPPFPSMYAYLNSARDMGNVKDIEEMIAHYKHLISKDKLLRVLMPGRTCAVHLTQAIAFKHMDGYIGIKDFRGKVIEAMEEAGWIYYGEHTIDKNPQLKAQRTKDRGLLFKTLATDSSHMHAAMADYLLQFRKPGDNPNPIRAGISEKYKNPDGWITNEEWIEWAAPVWYRQTPDYPGGIKETDVLNVAQARDSEDEKHLCALQLGVIERCVKLWSAPGDIVLDPFNGIGSTGYRALQLNRQYIGIELKPSYYQQAIRNLKAAEVVKGQTELCFDDGEE